MRLCRRNRITSLAGRAAAGVLALAISGLVAQTCHADLIMNNWNGGGVFNGGASPGFLITQPYEITMIFTYHWNWGSGDTPGNLGLYRASDGATWWWPAATAPGYGSLAFIVYPMVTIDPGIYWVRDDRQQTWSWNEQSGYNGFARVEGNPVPEPATLSLLALGGAAALLRRRR